MDAAQSQPWELRMKTPSQIAYEAKKLTSSSELSALARQVEACKKVRTRLQSSAIRSAAGQEVIGTPAR